ncbi:transcription factor domain-containing protein [Aspergillus ruber CBS 135680]|uniref:Xylanolytic transcriptional activator regulatory domain-containing protein n=1 Tax=Aspergillus ruber (strain CBS 135680) TaxID=1388766 RepID=A0A017SDS9_ASPRC|nr:uncharacterized protein EURHEDRAFT_523434 [Aspergillus ruber CBS 135680]EYE94799.1 hypothetical protein EURHEDRAFT_523434 [Aspergillus ruber CBS 135680]
MAKDRSNLGESGERNASLDAVDEKDNDEDDDGIKDVPQTAGSGAQRLGRSSSTISPVDGRSHHHSTAENLGFISTFPIVIAIGLQYAGAHLAAIRERLLDIMALGTLEAAQTCVLLGTYYLFHGDPGLAWPVCGCALRIAQALHLHRKLRLLSTDNERPSMAWRNENETRKQCRWAIYEIETFCSMSC